MTSPETKVPKDDARLTSAIDRKFADGVPMRGGIVVREHEEEIRVVPTTPLSRCPTADRVSLVRPIPEEAEEAREKWSVFGGHRVTILEAGGNIQTDFLARDGQVFMRRNVEFERRSGRDPEERQARAEALLADALSYAIRGPEERVAENEALTIGTPMPPEEVGELLAWIDASIPEPPQPPQG